MSDDLEYRIIPEEVNLLPIPTAEMIPLSDEEKERIRERFINSQNNQERSVLGGCATILVITISSIVPIMIGEFLGLHKAEQVIGPACIGGFLGWFVPFAIKKTQSNNRAMEGAQREIAKKEKENAEQQKSWIEQENQKQISRVNSNAKFLTSELKVMLTRSMSLAPELKQHLSQASSWLGQAQNEFNSNAFAPFWDAIENAAKHLALFNDKANELSRYADEYYRKLNNVKHTFPVFPVKPDTIPDASLVINEFRRTVRLGQTNFQFANIWEHRMTREVLLAGFRTLGEAVNNLGWSIETSVSSLKQSVSSDIAKVVGEQIKTRNVIDQHMLEQNRMLDNIQNHRKP